MKYIITLLIASPFLSGRCYAQEEVGFSRPVLVVFTNEQGINACPPCLRFAQDYREDRGGLRTFLTKNFAQYVPQTRHYIAVEWQDSNLLQLASFGHLATLYRDFIYHCPSYGNGRLLEANFPTFWVKSAKDQYMERYLGPESLITFLQPFVEKPPTIIVPPNPDLPPQGSEPIQIIDDENGDWTVAEEVEPDGTKIGELKTGVSDLKDQIKTLTDQNASILEKLAAVKNAKDIVSEAKEDIKDLKEDITEGQDKDEIPWWYGLLGFLPAPLKKLGEILGSVLRR